MLRELHRTWIALRVGGTSNPTDGAGSSGTAGGTDASGNPAGDPSITRIRGVMQIGLTVILVPLCLWVLFARGGYGATASSAASALLGAIVTFWLKD